MGPNGDPAFCHKIEKLVGDTVQLHIDYVFPKDFKDAAKVHQFLMSGCLGLIKNWIETPVETCDSPEHMAELAYILLSAAFKASF